MKKKKRSFSGSPSYGTGTSAVRSMKDACKLWAELSSVPTVSEAFFAGNDAICTVTKRPDLEEKPCGKVQMLRRHSIEGEKRAFSTAPVRLRDTSKVVVSPDGSMFAVVTKRKIGKGGRTNDLEIWTDDDCYPVTQAYVKSCPKQRRVENDTSESTGDLHGDIYVDNQVGRIAWSSDSRFLAYVAERSPQRANGGRTPTSVVEYRGADETKTALGNAFEHRFDLGEQFEKRFMPEIFLVDVLALRHRRRGHEIDVLQRVPTPEDVAVGDPQVHSNFRNVSVVYTCWDVEPKRYGLVYCPMRPSKICTQTRALGLKSQKLYVERDGVPPNVETFAERVAEIKACNLSRPGEEEEEGEGEKEKEEEDRWSPPRSLTAAFQVAHTPRLSPCGERLALLATERAAKTHNTTHNLVICERPLVSGESRCRIVVRPVADTFSGDAFAGFYGALVGSNVWFGHDVIVLPTVVRSNRRAVIVEVETGNVRSLTLPSQRSADANAYDLELLDIRGRRVVARWSSPSDPPMLLMGTLPTKILCGQDNKTVTVSWSPTPICCARERYSSLVSYRASRCEVRQLSCGEVDGGDRLRTRSFESIFTRPLDESADSSLDAKRSSIPPPPLVVMPHGGPHSVSTTSFSVALAFFNAAGFATLQVNYRGSTGFGQVPLESLPGSVGTNDIADVRHAVDDVAGEIDETRIFYAGGSHGGFLGLHFALKDRRCRAVAVRNPVTNFCSLWGSSDISDWSVCEALGLSVDPKKVPTAEEMKIMWQCSPVSLQPFRGGHPDREVPPILFLLGAKDRRVPVSQGLHMAETLRQAGVPVRVLMYPEDNHPLSSPETAMDKWANTLMLFLKFGRVKPPGN